MWLDGWRRFRRNKGALGALVFVCLLVTVALCAPVLAPSSPFHMNFEEIKHPPFLGAWFGTDRFGRDELSRIIWGSRVSLLVGFTTAAIAGAVGISLGLLSGFLGGTVGNLAMRLVDLFLVLPTFFLVLVVASIFGQQLWVTIGVMGLTLWPGTARLVRAEALSLREREFIMAAHATGGSKLRIMVRHVLPSAVQPAIVNLSLVIASAILLEASLSFLGLGDPHQVSWGWMLNDALASFRNSWWTGFFPGLAITLTVVAFNLLGDGLNDALSPQRSLRQ